MYIPLPAKRKFKWFRITVPEHQPTVTAKHIQSHLECQQCSNSPPVITRAVVASPGHRYLFQDQGKHRYSQMARNLTRMRSLGQNGVLNT